MRPSLLLSFVGFVILIAATYCPILHPVIGSWNVYDSNKPYGIVILLVAVVGIIGAIFNRGNIVRLAAWLSLALVVLFYILTLLKIHYSFTFIPLHFLAKYLTSKIKFKWGWYLLVGGPLLALAGSFFRKRHGFK